MRKTLIFCMYLDIFLAYKATEQELDIQNYIMVIILIVVFYLIFRNQQKEKKSNYLLKQQNQEIISQKEELRKSYENTQTLSEIGKKITATLDLNIIFEQLYENVNLLMDATIFGVGLYNKTDNTIDYELAIEHGVKYLPYKRDMNDKSQLAVQCIDEKKEFLVNEVNEIGNLMKLEDGEISKKPNSLIYIPLLGNEDAILGVIAVQSFKKNAYTEYHLYILRNLAIYTAIALENSKLIKETRQKNQNLKNAYQEISKKNQDIHDSIKVAERIQKSLLPSQDMIKENFEEFFILYMPRDMVSGDFYWFTKQKNIKIMVVADCTGHGVPGALISMIGMQLLDKIVNENRILEPQKILQILHWELVKLLKQKESQVKEGMDISVISLSKSTQNEHLKLDFSGAMNPFYFVQNNELQDIKADKKAIGGGEEKREFTQKTFEISPKTSVYLFSDGFQDQFGGEKNKKFMTSNFKKLLLEIHQKPMQEQYEILNHTIKNWIWVANETQTDDITVVGFKA